MLVAKSMFSHNSNLLSRMVPPKNVSKLVFVPKGSFGGHNQQSVQDEVRDSSGQSNRASGSVTPLSLSETAKMDRDFPPLGNVDALSALSAANPQGGRRKPTAGSSYETQTQHMPPTSATGRGASSNSRRFHRGADEDDDWILGPDEDDFAPRTSSRSTKKSSSRKQTVDVGSRQSEFPNQDRIYFLGRLLTNILRHRATDLHLQVRNDGYVVMDDLLKLEIKTRRGVPLSAYTVEDVLKAVERDNKQRFSLLTENDVLLIRANQGHSIKTIESEKLLKRIVSLEEIPAVCVHGTLMGNLDSILKTGLKRMGRNHVHFASGLPKEDGVISGMRHTSDVLIYLDLKKALQDGMQLYLSVNGVILTEGFNGVVPPEYFAKIARWKNGKATPILHNVKTASK